MFSEFKWANYFRKHKILDKHGRDGLQKCVKKVTSLRGQKPLAIFLGIYDAFQSLAYKLDDLSSIDFIALSTLSYSVHIDDTV